jgi:hypothetical protein
LGGGLGSGVAGLTARVIAGKIIGSQVLGVGSRALLNSAGSGLIGGGVTLAQNAFNKNVLGKNMGLWDGVEDNAVLSAKLGAIGSFVGDSVEIGAKRLSQAYKQFRFERAWERMTLEQRLWSTSNAITSYVKPSNAASIAGTTVSNAIANSAPPLGLLLENSSSAPNTNK